MLVLRFLWALLCAAFLLGGCSSGGSGGTGAPGSPNVPPPPASTLGRIQVQHSLLRAITPDITDLRFTGFGPGTQRTYGPETRPKAPTIVLENVPITTRELQIEYLRSGSVRGIWRGPVTLSADQTFTIEDPAYTDVEARLSRLEISPAAPTVAIGLNLPLQATAIFDDNTRTDVTDSVQWTVSNGNASIVTVAGAPQLRGVTAGQVELRATLNGVTAAVPATVSAAQLQSLEIRSTVTTLPVGTQEQLAAWGTFSDGTVREITTSVQWNSSASAAATVNASGLLTALQAGQTQISAALNGVQTSRTFVVSAAVLTSLRVEPTSVSLPAGVSTNVTVTAVFSDTSTLDVTDSVSWQSSAPTVASASGNRVDALSVGTAQLTANYNGQSVPLPVNVTPAALTGLQIQFALPQLPAGTSEQLTASGTFTDNQVRDVTASVLWSATPASVGSVSNALGQEGLATGLQPGVLQVTASLAGQQAALNITVGPAVKFVRNSAPANGDGSFSRPFRTIPEAVNAAGQDTTIFVFAGTGVAPSPVALKPGQVIRGEALGYPALSIPAGPRPVLTASVTMASRSKVEGVGFNAVSGHALTGSGLRDIEVNDVTAANCIIDTFAFENVAGSFNVRNTVVSPPRVPYRALLVTNTPEFTEAAEASVTNCTFQGYVSVEQTEPLVEFALGQNTVRLQGLTVDGCTFSGHRGPNVQWSGNLMRWTRLQMSNSTIDDGSMLYSNSATNSIIEQLVVDNNSAELFADFYAQLTTGNVSIGQGSISNNTVHTRSGYFHNLQITACNIVRVADNKVTTELGVSNTAVIDGYLRGSTPGLIGYHVTNNTFQGPMPSWVMVIGPGDERARLNIKNNSTEAELWWIIGKYETYMDFSGNSGRNLELEGGFGVPMRVEQATQLGSMNSFTNITQTRVEEIPDGTLGF